MVVKNQNLLHGKTSRSKAVKIGGDHGESARIRISIFGAGRKLPSLNGTLAIRLTAFPRPGRMPRTSQSLSGDGQNRGGFSWHQAIHAVYLGSYSGRRCLGDMELSVNFLFLMPRYKFGQDHHELLSAPRYPLFLAYWFVTLFVLTYILTWVYASARATFGPGPVTALQVGLLIGFSTTFH